MTDKEKIIAEIERLKAEAFNNVKNRSLVTDVANSQRIAICEQLLHFINSLPAEQPSENLEEYYTKDFLPKEWFAKQGQRTLSEFNFFTASHFAQWQKEQMMKSSIDATCVLLPPPDLFKVLICHDVTNNLSKGQKVKIITVTVKEDEQCSTE